MLRNFLFFFVILLSIPTMLVADEKSDDAKLYQTLVQTLIQAIQDQNYEQVQNAFENYTKCQYTADYSEDIAYFVFLCCIHLHFDHQDEVHHLMEQYYEKKKDDPMFMYFFSLLNTHFGNYEKAIDDMTNAIVTLEKEPQKFLSKYNTQKFLSKYKTQISDQTDLNNMLGATYLMRACLYAVVKNIANARTDMKKADTFLEMPGSFLKIHAIATLFYTKLDKMEQSPNSISLFIEKKQSFGHIVITNNIINVRPEVDFKWDENLQDIQAVFFNWRYTIKLGEKSDSDRSYQKLLQAIQDKNYERAQNAFGDYMKYQHIDYSEHIEDFVLLCCIHLHFDHQDEVRHLMEQYYAKKKDDPMFMHFFSLLNTHFGNYEKAIDDMTNAIVTLEKEPQKFLSKYKAQNISDQTSLNSMLGECYAARAWLYVVVKDIANARTDMKKADAFPEMPDTITTFFYKDTALFYKNLNKMEKSPNSISLIVEKNQSFGHIVITNNIINVCPEVDFKWDEKSDCDRLYQTLVQAIQDKNYEQVQNAFENYMKCQYTADYSEDIGYFTMLCCIHLHFDHQDEVRHLMEQYYAKKKDDPMFMYFFSLLNTHFGNYEKAIDDMTNAIVTLEKEPQKFLSKYKNRYISAQTYLNHMLGQCYVTRACLYAVVKNIANARTDMKKADTFPEIPDTISFLFYKNLDKMEKSPNSISLVIKKKQSFDHIVIINHAIRSYPEVDFKWDENLPDIQDGFNWQFPVQLDEKSPYNIPSLEGVDIPLFLPPTQTPSLPVAPVTPQFEIPVVVH